MKAKVNCRSEIELLSQAVSFLTFYRLSLGARTVAGKEHSLPQGPGPHIVKPGYLKTCTEAGFGVCTQVLIPEWCDPCLGLGPLQSLDTAEVST